MRMLSRHDEKGGDGMSISASSVTLISGFSSPVKSDAGWPEAGVFGAGRPQRGGPGIALHGEG